MKFWTWITGNLLTVAIIIAVLVIAWFEFQGHRDKGDTVQDALLKQQIQTLTADTARRSAAQAETSRQLDIALANGTKIVDRWHESAPRAIPVGTPHDSVVHLQQQVRECRQVGDSLAASIIPIRSSCTAFRDTAKKIEADLHSIISLQNQRIDILRKGKRVETYGDGLYDFLNQRPVFRVGTKARAFWNVNVMGEAEYSIRSNKDTLSGDGLRLLGGVHMRF